MVTLKLGHTYRSDDGQKIAMVRQTWGTSRDPLSYDQVPLFVGNYEEDGKLKTDWFYEDGVNYFGADMRRIVGEWDYSVTFPNGNSIHFPQTSGEMTATESVIWTPEPSCTCETFVMMNYGCQCGAFAAEQRAKAQEK